MAQPPSRIELGNLVKTINSNSLLNKQLQRICSLNGLRSNGVKADLQRRIVEAVTKSVTDNDTRQFREIERSIWNERNNPGGSSNATPQARPEYHPNPPSAAPVPSKSLPMTNFNFQNGYAPFGTANAHRAQPIPAQTFIFQESPFYRIMSRLGEIRMCEAMASHRNSITISIKPTENQLLTLCERDPTIRVMLFCAAANTGVQEIAFPHQSELKVNGGEVKANLRGLKNKPGSTRPVDITDHLRLNIPAYTNNVEFTYALTNKRFWLVANICKTVPVTDLARNITKKISKASVVLELTRKANDAEIEMSSQVLSLKCPLSYMRLSVPCRATTCTHIQCFDATSYLQLQEQGPQWLCPICSKPAPYDRLAVDEYVRDILARTLKSVEQVDIEPHGEWKVHGDQEQRRPEPQHETFALLDDDDLVISDNSPRGNHGTHTPSTPAGIIGTPATNPSRESSSMPLPRSTTKRPHAVIDLTGSDDDDDEPPRPPKKQQHYSNNHLAGYPSF